MVMKPVFFLAAICCSICSVYAGDWREHWIDAVARCEEQNSIAAEWAFNKAIHLMEKTGDDSHPYVYVDRARLYSANERYDEALADLNQALDSPHLKTFDRERALFTRMVVLYQMGRVDEGIQDLHDYQQIANLPHAEFSNDTILIRNIPDGESHQTYLKKALVGTGLCESEADIQMYSGTCIARCRPCGCERELSNLTAQQCNRHCDQSTLSTMALIERTFKTWACKSMSVAVVSFLNDACHWCCSERNFYQRCISHFGNFLSYMDESCAP